MVVIGLQEVVLISAIFVFGIPAWLFALGVYLAARRRRDEEPSRRYFAYSRILTFVHESMRTGEIECGAVWAAAIRELAEYPEYADLSILYLEEINVNGTKKFDRILEEELKGVEARLLEKRND